MVEYSPLKSKQIYKVKTTPTNFIVIFMLITGVIFPPKDEIARAEEIVEGLKNLKRLANTTVDGTFVAECPVCKGKSNF